jgi:histidinol-phosphatase (PHP family)
MFSDDSETQPEDIVKYAMQLGLSHICFTDHNDFDYPPNEDNLIFLLDVKKYISSIRKLQLKYKEKIDILIGVEQGLQPHLTEITDNFDLENELDFIIGSTHIVDGADPYYPSFWESRSFSDSICEYFNNIYKSICACSNFDVYGHLDYIVRYAPEKDLNYKPSVYADVIDAILKKLIENGKGIELNTAGLRYGLKEANPCLDILKRYRQLGGEIITTGSDAHKTEHLASHFDILKDILNAAGFSYYTIFRKRKPEFIRLS